MVGTALAIEREMEDSRGHSRCECRWEEEGGLAFFEFGKETEDLCPTSAPSTGLAKANDMLLLPSAWAHEKGLSTNNAIPVIIGIIEDIVCSFSPNAGQRD